jgi:hypothetical protein
MPHVDYWDIANELAEILRAGLGETLVVVEEELMLALEQTPRVGVYIEGRELPPSQPLAAGRISRIHLRMAVWCWCGAIELRQAIKDRDALVAQVETVLLSQGDRTINGKVDTFWLEGGELPSSRLPNQNGFISGGEILLRAELTTEV